MRGYRKERKRGKEERDTAREKGRERGGRNGGE